MHCECPMQLIHGEKDHLSMIASLWRTDIDSLGILGLDIAHVWLFFSFTHNNVKYFCALVHWFSHMSESVDSSTGMWVVERKVTKMEVPLPL